MTHRGEKFIILLKRKPMAFTVAMVTVLFLATGPMIRYLTALSAIIAKKEKYYFPMLIDVRY